jgi:hypothetical protein
MKELYGTYLGCSGLGEGLRAYDVGGIEITVNDEGFKIQLATALNAAEELLITVNELSPMSLKQIESECLISSPLVERTVGYCAQDGLLKFLFFKGDRRNNEFGLKVHIGGILSEYAIGPTFLYSPAQVASGAFEELVRSIEEVKSMFTFWRLEGVTKT